MDKSRSNRGRRVLKIMLSLLLVGFILIGSGLLWISYQFQTMAFLDQVPACEPETLHLGGVWGSAAVSVEIADTDETRARGLMFRDELPSGSGMLFAYPQPQTVAFWMKDTPIPLDILFFDSAGDLRHVHFNAQPFDETPIPGGTDIQYVLEIYSGETANLGIGPQTTLRHPILDQENARWKC